MQTTLGQQLKTFVVMNPVAGQKEPGSVQETLRSRLEEQAVPYEIYETTGKENIREVVEQALREGATRVLASGGDGTVSAAASALVGKDAVFGIIPAGTWNTLARNLDIPLDLVQALDLALGQYDIRAIDVLEVDGRYYMLNVSAGAGTSIMSTIEREEIRKLGKLTFLWKGVLQVLGYPPHQYKVTIDGKTTYFRASELIVANSGVVGIKSIRLDPDIHIDDGKFNICRIQAKNFQDYIALGFSMLTGGQHEDPRLDCWEASNEVRIESRQRLQVQADGEIIGYLPVVVRLRPQALNIIVPVKPEQ
jgi:YegS/Rv2252/BmrU family lipid kinase